MRVDAHVQKTKCPRKDNGRTCPGPLSNKQSPREMIVVEHARSPCRTSTFLNTWHLISVLFWLCFLWCISLVSVCGNTFPLFQFAVILSLVSTCYGAFSCRSQDNRGTRSGPMSKKHPPRSLHRWHRKDIYYMYTTPSRPLRSLIVTMLQNLNLL